MTTETTCWSSIWQTDDTTKEYFVQHGRPEAYKELKPADVAYYDGCIELDLSTVECMIALPMHPSYAYPIRELKANAKEILQVRENAAIALRNFSQEMKGTISIAASTVPSQYYLPHLLQDFRARYPDITFNIQMETVPRSWSSSPRAA